MAQYGPRELAESFRIVRKNTIQVAHDIPEEQYGFRAAEGIQSVGEMLAHVALATHWAQQLHFVDRKREVTMADFGRYREESQSSAAALTSKADILAALESRGRDFAAAIERMSDADLAEHVMFPAQVQPPSKSRFEMLLSVKEHEMHHRGQLMLVERLLGIVPHLTRARQSR